MRAFYTDINWQNEFFITDYLGNARVTFESVGGALRAKDFFDVDPYGVPLKAIVQSSSTALENNFKMQGKEELGFGLDGLRDFGARFSDATIGGIWNAVDPLADAFEDVSPMSYCLGNPITMVDIDGMFADSAKSQLLPEVIVTAKAPTLRLNTGPTLQPFTGFWGNVDYFWNGGNFGRYHYNQQGEPTGLAPIGGTAPDIGMKSGVNTVYKGVKFGLPYIGKAFNILKRYTKSDRLRLRITSVIDGVSDTKLLRAVEQKILEYKKTTGEVANKINAFDPKRKDYPEYMQKATQWLEQNVPNWQKLFE